LRYISVADSMGLASTTLT